MKRTAHQPRATPQRPTHPLSRGQGRLLRLIALMKFVKACLMIAVGLGAVRLLNPDIAARAQEWAESLAAAPERNVVLELVNKVLAISPDWLHWVGIGAFVYAAVFIAEGVGLWLERRWAEWLTVVATSLLIPFEVYEIAQKVTPLRVGALILNLAVVAYLVYLLRRHVDDPRSRRQSH